MVYSSELGYDPDEWEECPDEEHRMLFGFFTRMLLSLFAVGSTVFLLWFMEARKQWAKAAKECKEPVYVETIVKEEDEEIHVISELPQKLVKETRVEPSFTKEEEEALEEWRREVARLEEARLRELDDRMCDGSSVLSEIETESQLIDSLLPADEIAMDLDTAEQEHFQVLKNVCATPPCTPPDTSGVYGKTLPFEEITKKLTADGQGISEVPSEQHEFELVKEMGTTNANGLADWEAPPIAEFLGEPSEVYPAKRVGEPIAGHVESGQARASTDGEEGFVKVYDEHEEKLKERNVAEVLSKGPEGVAEIEHIYDVPAVEIGSQDTQVSVHERTERGTSVKAMYNIEMQPETQQIEDYPRVPLEPEVVFGRPPEFEPAAIQQHPDAVQVAAHLKSGPDFSQVAATSEQNLDLSQVPPAELAPPQFTDSLPVRTSSTSDGAKVEHAEHIVSEKNMQQMDQKEAEELKKLFEEYDILEKPNEQQDVKSSFILHDTHPLGGALQQVEQPPIHVQQGVTHDHKIEPTIDFHSDQQKKEFDGYVDIVGEQQGISRVELSASEYPAIQIASDEVRRLAEADIYVQDAMEYVSSQRPTDTISGFVIEEDMLESVERSGQAAHVSGQHNAPASAEATSQLVKTNEAFEKIEQIAEIDDTMTYAPEIQSIEIPPDQASENSEILQEYFDQVAAECTNVFKMPLMQARTATATGSGMPARRLEYSPSISSIRSGKSYTSSEGLRKQSSLLSALGVTSMQEMLLTLTSLEALSAAMAKAGLESTNLIFGIDYTASNKYQGEHCFGGRSLHSLDPLVPNPYQQVISVMGRTLAPFATSGFIPAYGFGDSKTGDWSVFKLKEHGECRDLDEVLSVYNEVTPTISLSGPTNFAPLIYQAIEICERVQDYHILVIVADGQVTNEKATRKAIVRACQYPLSIIVVGVGDGPWEMMRIFDESLPKRPWDNFHFVEFDEVMRKASSVDSGEVTFAIQSLLEIPDQYNTVRQLGLIRGSKSVSKAK